MDFQDGVLGVLLAGEQGYELGIVDTLFKVVTLVADGGKNFLLLIPLGFRAELEERLEIVAGALQAGIARQDILEAAFFLEKRGECLRIAPGIRLGNFLFDFFQALLVPVGVKDAPIRLRSVLLMPGTGDGVH